MTTKQLVKRLRELAGSTVGWSEPDYEGESPESAHVKADRTLLEYLEIKKLRKHLIILISGMRK